MIAHRIARNWWLSRNDSIWLGWMYKGEALFIGLGLIHLVYCPKCGAKA